MTEQNNKALVQSIYDAFGRGDLQTILSHLAPDVEWSFDGPQTIPFAGRRIGPGQVRGFFESLAATQTGQYLTTDEFIAQGDKVVTMGRYAAVVTATGRKIDSPIAHVFTIRDGRVTKFILFADTAQMADAYGLASVASRGR